MPTSFSPERSPSLTARVSLSPAFPAAPRHADAIPTDQRTLLAGLVESILDGVLIVSPDGRMLHHNQHFLDIWKFPAEVLQSGSDEAALRWAAEQTADPAAFLERVGTVYRQPNEKFREELVMKDGRVFERFGAPVIEAGTRLGWVWTFRDISERKRAEVALQRSEERYRLVTRATQDVIWDWDMTNDEVVWNESLHTVFGYPPSQAGAVIRGAVDWWTAHLHPDDRDRVARSFQAAATAQSTQWIEHYRFLRADGSYAEVNDVAFIDFNSAGQPVRMVGAMSDVTVRKRAEARERELVAQTMAATAKFRAIFDQSAVLAAIMTLEGTVLDANRASLQTCGYRSEEVIGRPFWECGWWQGLPEVQAKLKAATILAAQGTPYTEELSYRWADGTLRTTAFGLHPIRDDADRIIFLHPTGMDITERRQQLESTELLTRLTRELAQLSDSREINRIATRIVGEHLRAQRCYFFEVMPDARHVTVLADWRLDREATVEGNYDLSLFGLPEWWQAAQREPLSIDDVNEHPWTRDFGAGYRAINIGAYVLAPFVDRGRWVASISVSSEQPRHWTAHDKTLLENVVARVWPLLERARAMETLRATSAALEFALESAKIGDWDLDVATDVARRSLRHDRCFGYQELLPEWGFETFLRHVHPDDRGSIEQDFRQAMSGAEDWHFECRVIWPDGSLHWIAAHGRLFTAGPSPRLLGIVMDITQRKHAEDSLAQQNERLERTVLERTARLQETIGELEAFSYSIAHDMRAPLRSLQSFSDILLEEHSANLNEEAQGFLGRIARSAGRMDKLIQDVLSYSRVVQGDSPLESVHVDQLLRGILDTYPMFAPDKVDIVVTAPLPPVLGNEAMLMQIFSNLMGNAVKFVAAGAKPHIHIWAETHGREVRLFVQDQGIGIAPDQHERIFGIFQQANTGFEGTGIGLAIVKKAVQRMGGKVGVRSAPGAGTTFWVDLPQA